MENTDQKILLSWTAPEFIRQTKSAGWFVVFAIITVLLLFLSVWLKNYFFSGLIILTAALFFVQALKFPRTFRFSVLRDGIKIGDRLLLYKEIHSFWIFEEPSINALSLTTKNLLNSHLLIPLGQQPPAPLRSVLAQYIKEVEHEEGLIDWLARIIKF